MKLRNRNVKRVHVRYAKPIFKSGIYIDDRPNGIVVSYDLLSMSWPFVCYELLLYEWSHFRLVLAIVL